MTARLRIALVAWLLPGAALFARGAVEEKVSLSFWLFGGTSVNLQANAESVKQGNAAYTNTQVTITYQGRSSPLEQLRAALQSGTAPDVARVPASVVATLADADALQPLDGFPDFIATKALFVPGFVESLKADGHYWGAPDSPILTAILAHSDGFAAAGVSSAANQA